MDCNSSLFLTLASNINHAPMKLLAFAGSSSKHSINKQLATYAASLFTNVETEILDLNDYELPLFSVDRESL